MPISIRDKVVVVTGGAGEMGSSLSRRLVEEGAAVVMVDIADGREMAAEIKRGKRGNKIVTAQTEILGILRRLGQQAEQPESQD